MANKLDIIKKIIKEEDYTKLEIENNGKCLSIATDKLGYMTVSLGYIDEEKTDNYQDYFDVPERSGILDVLKNSFKFCEEDMVFFDTTNGNLVLDRKDGLNRFLFMKEFTEGADEISINLLRDNDSNENNMLKSFFNFFVEKEKESEKLISNYGNILHMTKTGSSSMSIIIQDGMNMNPIGPVYFKVKEGELLYDELMSCFTSFGGNVNFDICNGSLTLCRGLDFSNKPEFIFSYERWQNSDPSNKKEFTTSLFDNTLENKALFRFFDLIERHKNQPKKGMENSPYKYVKIKQKHNAA